MPRLLERFRRWFLARSVPFEKTGSIRTRRYASYSAYLDHQKAKLQGREAGTENDQIFANALAVRLVRLKHLWPTTPRVICLGARRGVEVKVFRELGCFAIGIDLNPGIDNEYVSHGDFHRLAFSDGSCDIVFTNSLDHALEIPRVMAEVRRVLSRSGILIAEIVAGSEEGRSAGFFEAVEWKHASDIVELINQSGFTAAVVETLEVPWTGLLVVAQRQSTDS